ncbi:RNHCP domain-containing protein [Candidatus Gracilibacteria bacterium]|nr:RNHCP domain-containing protein [Candidatus Gracilibacteria bacterium]
MRNEGFICEYCKKKIKPHGSGSARNHCPFCFYSKHVDLNFPGDRLSDCKEMMEPIGIDYNGKKGYMIKHKCIKCGKENINKIAPDDEFVEFIKKSYISTKYKVI